MMLCENCKKNEATTHIKTVINGKVTSKNLCSYCAAKLGYNHFGHDSLANMLASVFSDMESDGLPEKRCNCCHSRFSDIAETGRVGCAECYKTFKDELMPYIKRLHGSTSHVGKKPSIVSSAGTLVSVEKAVTGIQRNRVDVLREELKNCIEREEYEKAAKLRDEIRDLTKEG